MLENKINYTIGIDEAGRGPLAGPVAVGVVLIQTGFNRRFFSGIRDSKQLTEIQREKWFGKMEENKNIRHAVCFTNAGQIDKFGIVKSVNKAMKRALERLNVSSKQCRVLLDGRLKAPSIYKLQKTIIKGDEKEPIISLASVVAKVKRDRKMIRLAKRYPKYCFEKHKGYGTRLHYKKIKKYGPCTLHRRSFIIK
ncbi:MAG: ribonuclease HII [Candidatus Pacebacteria bacterium]|jgi:ribonuclease HII|nr:ribonuclease HII [Candidatus Paceibacterota bacterium]|tara:strand:- start:4645 stop:5229 length:585 start_codon:yes stop_codon:yes gene_type:complete